MSFKEAKKFNEWAQKIRSTLEALPDEDAYNVLPDQIRLLRDWGNKLRKKELSDYLKVRNTEIDLLSKSAYELHRHYLEYLSKAKKHRVGTKVRMNEILRYVYYYSKDVQPNLTRAGKEEQNSKYFKSFWNSYLDEIVESIDSDLLDDFQLQCVRAFAEQSKDAGVGLEFVDELISKLELKIKKPQILFKILKRLYRDELLVLAGALSESRKKWSYDKRSKTSMAEAIVQNCAETDLVNWLRRFCGKKLPKEIQRGELKVYPSAIQIGKFVLGPFGLIEGPVKRSRYSSETTRIVLEEYLGKVHYLRYMLKELEKEISYRLRNELWQDPTSEKQKTIQIILAHAKDEKICALANQLLAQGEIRIKVSDLYDEIEDIWVVTRHGLFIRKQEKTPVENLVDLLKQEFKEEDLTPELDMYYGDFESKILGYCIKENPEKILTRMFGLIRLKQLAKKLGFCRVDSLHNPHEVATLIMLKLGFSVPPSLIGLRYYMERLQSCKTEISKIVDSKMISGQMSQAYVDMEGVLRNLLYFYVGFLWSNEIEDMRWEIKFGDALRRILKNKLKIKTPKRITFGQTIHAIRKLNAIVKGNKKLKNKMQKTFDRNWIMNRNHLEALDKISAQRANFVHFKKFPGHRICMELVDDMLDIVKKLAKDMIFPCVIRIVAEIADDYGKNYSRAIDENGNEWTIYYNKWLDTTVPYFMHSKTNIIAVNPILVQKIQ